MTTTLFVNGEVLDQAGRRSADVRVDSDTGLVVEVGTGLEPGSSQVTDIAGCVLTPGFVDLATHLREPGSEAAETIVSGSRAAAGGGYTAIVAMPDTDPCVDSSATLSLINELGAAALCEVAPAGAISVGRTGNELAPIGELAARGVCVFTDAGSGVQNPQFLRRAFEYADSIDPNVVLMQSGVVAELAEGSVMHEGRWSVELGVAGQPALAEVLLVERDLALARLTGGRIHIQVSTAGAVAALRGAKANGVRVTASVTPHHLALTDAACASYDPVMRVEPPLRTSDDIAALVAGLADGTIDAIATSHEPHTPDAKERPFDQAPCGVIGLETAFAVSVEASGLELEQLVGALSWRPAAIAGLGDRHGRPVAAGEPANLTIIDPNRMWTVDKRSFMSQATNSPFIGRKLTGKVRHTVYQGQLVVNNEEATR